MPQHHPPSASTPPPLPDGDTPPQHIQASNKRPARTPKKRSSLAGLWVLLLLMGGASFLYWQYELAKFRLFGFQPPEMAMARYTPKDVIGDLGGLKVRIPGHYAEYVVYDGDPRFGEKRKGPVPERTFDSKLRSFGIKVRFPEMKGQETTELAEDYLITSLTPTTSGGALRLILEKTIRDWEPMPAMDVQKSCGQTASIGGRTMNVCLRKNTI